jgi:LAO/AO transport system kinase
MDLWQGVLGQDRLCISRAISLIEDPNRWQEARALLAALYPHTGRAHYVGITGAPGTGKSTLINRLAGVFREQGKHVGVIAVDPTSPYSGGALLGDRIRMSDLVGDRGIFVRSMATRGTMGGISQATADAMSILDAAGFGVVLVETVGVGQDEVEVSRCVHTVVVVEAPGQGDQIQAIKAGLTEIADIFVVNKAERDDADQTVHALEVMLEMGGAGVSGHGRGPAREQGWKVPICKTVALDGTGVPDLAALIGAHRVYLQGDDRWHESNQRLAQARLEALLRQALFSRFVSGLEPGRVQEIVGRIAERELTPYGALEELGVE